MRIGPARFDQGALPDAPAARRLHCTGQTDLQSNIGPDLAVEGRTRVALCEVERGCEACTV
jgi:hypothetical protein